MLCGDQPHACDLCNYLPLLNCDPLEQRIAIAERAAARSDRPANGHRDGPLGLDRPEMAAKSPERRAERTHPSAGKTTHRRFGGFPPDSGDPPPDAGRAPRLGADYPSWGLDERREFLNGRYPSSSLGGRPPLVAFPEARHSGRPYRLEWEEELLDMQRVADYLAGGRWYGGSVPRGRWAREAIRTMARAVGPDGMT